jgi:hypothetical protein
VAGTVRKEMMLESWQNQKDDTVSHEITTVSNIEQLNSLPQSVKFKGGSNMNAQDLCKAILKSFNSKASGPLLPTILIFSYAILRSILPGLLNLAVGIRFHGNTTEEAVLFYYIALFQMMYFTVLPMFFKLLFRDFRMQLSLTKSANNLLERLPIAEAGENSVSIDSENDKLALVVAVRLLDKYGERYLNRHKALISSIVAHSFFLILAMFPFYFNIFRYSNTNSSEIKLQ